MTTLTKEAAAATTQTPGPALINDTSVDDQAVKSGSVLVNTVDVMKAALIFFFTALHEVIATTSFKFSEGFTKLLPSLIVVVGYGLSFYLLSISLKVMPIGIAYALWSGIGIALTGIAGKMFWHEMLDPARLIGIGLILLDLLVINLFSKGTEHESNYESYALGTTFQQKLTLDNLLTSKLYFLHG